MGKSEWEHLDHSASKEPKNPFPEWIHRFLWYTVIQVILDQWSFFGFSQRNTPKYKLKYIFESANKSKNPKKEKAFKLSMEGLIGLMYVSHSPNREAVVARSATPPWMLFCGTKRRVCSFSSQGIESCFACLSLFVVFVSYGCKVLVVTYLAIVNIQ